jgi:hypothetical protein
LKKGLYNFFFQSKEKEKTHHLHKLPSPRNVAKTTPKKGMYQNTHERETFHWNSPYFATTSQTKRKGGVM